MDCKNQYSKGFQKNWSGSLAKRRLCLGPANIINCTPLKKKKKKKKKKKEYSENEYRTQSNL